MKGILKQFFQIFRPKQKKPFTWSFPLVKVKKEFSDYANILVTVEKDAVVFSFAFVLNHKPITFSSCGYTADINTTTRTVNTTSNSPLIKELLDEIFIPLEPFIEEENGWEAKEVDLETAYKTLRKVDAARAAIFEETYECTVTPLK